jgi:hypothetical protein
MKAQMRIEGDLSYKLSLAEGEVSVSSPGTGITGTQCGIENPVTGGISPT